MYHDDNIEDVFEDDVVFDPDTEENKLEEKMRQADYAVTTYISMYDIKAAGIDWSGLSQEEKNGLLWSVGLDIKRYRYVTSKDLHVTSQGKRVECVRVICEERHDKEWIEGGMASDDAYLKYKDDPSFTREIKKMEDCYLPSIIK